MKIDLFMWSESGVTCELAWDCNIYPIPAQAERISIQLVISEEGEEALMSTAKRWGWEQRLT